ncbi:hypothetical protein ACIA8K_12620 [Catenuloplanes sp. NPDC051500]|uniref:Gp37-like protein n=1 Tax=Catenuloplanes sp. NPDC051500 TaxID=3363959 RepID=UPI0037A80751
MRLSDITVEVRNKNLDRLGLISPQDLDLEVDDVHLNVGSWKLVLPTGHPLAGALRTPGAGIIITGPDGQTMLSGPVVTPTNEATITNPGGELTFSGVTDMVLLADVLAYPDPTNPNPLTQGLANDVRTGPAETVMHGFVAANISPLAPGARRPTGTMLTKVQMGPNLGRGPTVTKSARFSVLGELLTDLATMAGLGFRMIQRGGAIVFETYAVANRTAEIRLDIRNSTLSGHKVATSPPGITRALVAGQDEGVKRQFVLRTTAASLAGEQAWGRRIERFIDQRNTEKIAELEQAGDEALAEGGFSSIAVQAVPMEDSSMPFGTSWFMGDSVTVVVEGQELSTTVSGYVMKAKSDGFHLGAKLGETSGFDAGAAIVKRVSSAESRIGVLESAGQAPVLSRLSTPADIPSSMLANAFEPGKTGLYLAPTQQSAYGLPGVRGGYLQVYGDGGDGAIRMFNEIADTGAPNVYFSSGNPSGWSAWRRVRFADDRPIMIGGTVAITPTAANTPTSVTVSFPAGLFTTIPIVQVTADTSVPGTQVTGVSFKDPTLTGCSIVLTRTNTSLTNVHWTATQF